MEHRILLTQEEAYEIIQKLEIIGIGFVKDTYTGQKRLRKDHLGKTSEKDYPIPTEGTTVRFSAKCKLGDIEEVWFEVKWTGERLRFEMEFEGEVPEEYKNRPNIKGWQILEV